MFCSRQSNSLINKVHERVPKLTYRAETKDFEQIRREQNEITIYQMNLQVLMTEVHKTVNGIVPPIINYLFSFAATQTTSEIFRKCLEKIGKLSNMGRKLTYRAPFRWANIHTKFKNAKSFD